jgi:nicotinic acid mononucleotide adenylyltransferase
VGLALTGPLCYITSMIKTDMKKAEPLLYKRAVTWGRFALPHTGHCSLIQQCLAHAEEVDVHISSHAKNNDADLRILLLRVLLRNRGVDLRRVNFYESPTIGEAMTFSIDMAPFNEVVLVLGSDQTDMLYSISDIYDTNYIINRRENSSTNMRYFLDSYDFLEDARYLYEDCAYATTLAYMLRAEERQRERSEKVARETRGVAA